MPAAITIAAFLPQKRFFRLSVGMMILTLIAFDSEAGSWGGDTALSMAPAVIRFSPDHI